MDLHQICELRQTPVSGFPGFRLALLKAQVYMNCTNYQKGVE